MASPSRRLRAVRKLPRLITLACMLAAPSLALAGLEAPDECTENQERAFEFYRGSVAGLEELVADAGGNPTASDCKQMCKAVTKSCAKVAKSAWNLSRDLLSVASRAAKTICKSAPDPSDCKRETKGRKALMKILLDAARGDQLGVCWSEPLRNACRARCERRNDEALDECEDLGIQPGGGLVGSVRIGSILFPLEASGRGISIDRPYATPMVLKDFAGAETLEIVVIDPDGNERTITVDTSELGLLE